jgi:hypothetical protein
MPPRTVWNISKNGKIKIALILTRGLCPIAEYHIFCNTKKKYKKTKISKTQEILLYKNNNRECYKSER